jgi:hypothetical protein
MLMATAEGVYLRVKNGVPLGGRVAVVVDLDSPDRSVHFQCTGSGWIAQGHLEEVPAVGYDDWKAGARAGIEFALSVAAKQSACVHVTRIVGMTTDSNPSSLAAAAAFAVWKALGHNPSPTALEELEAVVADSRTRPFDWVPVLEMTRP